LGNKSYEKQYSNSLSFEYFKKLSSDPNSQLNDARTKPEWAYVGVSDLSPIKNKLYSFHGKFPLK